MDQLHQYKSILPDDLTDPAPATTFAHLDATTVLSRKIAELVFIQMLIHWIPHQEFLLKKLLVKNIIVVLKE